MYVGNVRMSERVKRLRIVKRYAKEHTVHDPYPQFEIEPEIIEYVEYLNKLMPRRTVKNIDAVKGEMGWLGQELFAGLLLQFKIPCVYANAIYENWQMMRAIQVKPGEFKHFDFIVPHMPEGMKVISVKTAPEGYNIKRFMANVESWENEIHDIAVAVKIDNLKERKAYIVGWLPASEIITLPIHDFGQGEAYWTYLNPEAVELNRGRDIPGNASAKLKPLRLSNDQLMERLLSGGLKR